MLPLEALLAKFVELNLPREVLPHGLEDVRGHGQLERVPVLLPPDLRVDVVQLECA